MKVVLTRLLNIGLRSLTLGIRFLFVFFLARYLDPAAVGYYGLFTVTVGYCLYLVGLDFYTYMTREILKAPQERRGGLLKAQACLSTGLFLLLAPIAIAVLSYAGWSDVMLWWFLPILLCEYLNQEIYRLLVALSRQIAASVLMFLRMGSWAIVLLAVMIMLPDSRNLETVLALWGGIGLLTVAIGIGVVGGLRLGGWRDAIDWRWLRTGIAVSGAFLIATLALRGFQTLDRYWLESLGGLHAVAAYGLFYGVAGALLTFLDAGVFAFGYPELIRLHHNGDKAGTRTILRRMLAQTGAISVAFGITSWLALPYLLEWIDNPIYQERTDMFALLLLAMIINAIGMVPHYGLYACGRDKPIIYSQLASFVVFVLATWGLSMILPANGLELAVPLGMNVAFLTILIWKGLALLIPGDADSASHPSQPMMAHTK